MKKFGERLKELRVDNNERQADLADFLSVSKTTVCQWETNKQEPDFDTLVKIADHYAVSIDYLLGREN